VTGSWMCYSLKFKIQFPDLDGFYAPNLPSDWIIQDCSQTLDWKTMEYDTIVDGKFYMPAELALHEFTKLDMVKVFVNPKSICEIFAC